MQFRKYTAGILLKLLNLLFFTIISLISLYISSDVFLPQAFFFIACIACVTLFFITLFLQCFHKGNLLKLSEYKLAFVRAFFNVTGMLLWFETLKHLKANDATAISYIIPIFTTILAYVFCNERPTLPNILATALGILGMFIILQPNVVNGISYGAFICILSSISFSLHDIICKKQTAKEHYLTQSLYQFFYIAIMMLPFAIYGWSDISPHDLAKIITISMLSIINIIILFLAYKLAPIVVLMPFSYCRLILMSIGVYILFCEIPSMTSVLGACIITLTSLYIFYNQNKAINS